MASSGGAANGTPLKILTVGSLSNAAYSEPELAAGTKAAVKSINAAGGINGHPIDLSVCDDHLDPNGAITCARQAVDEKVVAVVSAAEYINPDFFTTIDKAGIPLIGTAAALPIEYTLASSFPLDGGLAGWDYGEVAALVQAGVKHPAIVTCDTDSCKFGVTLLTAALKLAGITAVRTVTTPLASTDLTSQIVSAVAGDVDGILTSTTNQQVPKIVVAARQASFKGPIAAISGVDQPAIIKAVGDNQDGIYIAAHYASPFDETNPAAVKFLADLKASDPSADPDQLTEHAWLGVQAFATIAKTLSTVDAPGLMKAMSSIDCAKPLELGLTTPYCNVGKTVSLPEYPRLFNMETVTLTIKDGKPVSSGPAFDPVDVLKKASGSN